MFRSIKVVFSVFIFVSLCMYGCGGDGDGGTGPSNGGGTLEGTWRVETTMTSANCPINFSFVDTVTYTEEDADLDFGEGEDCNCDIDQSGNQYTIDCTCTMDEDPCVEQYTVQGNGTVSENSYEFTYTMSWQVSNAPGCSETPACEVTVTGNGTRIGEGPGPQPENEPDISLSQTTHNFGNVQLGSFSSWTLTISNLGDEALTINSVTSSGVDFSVTTPTFPQTIGASGTLPVNIIFEPSGSGSSTATITITSNDPDEGTVTVNVSGIGVTNGGGADLFGTWLVITTSSTECQGIPTVTEKDTSEVTYAEGTTQPEWPEFFDCDIQTAGNTWTIDCNYNETIANCMWSYNVIGNGSFSETSYQMAYTMSLTVSGPAECAFIPECDTYVEIVATKVTP